MDSTIHPSHRLLTVLALAAWLLTASPALSGAAEPGWSSYEPREREGVLDTSWGMTVDQVVAAHPAAVPAQEDIFGASVGRSAPKSSLEWYLEDTDLLHRPAVLYFAFARGRLCGIGVRFTELTDDKWLESGGRQSNKAVVVRLCQVYPSVWRDMVEELSAIHGSPWCCAFLDAEYCPSGCTCPYNDTNDGASFRRCWEMDRGPYAIWEAPGTSITLGYGWSMGVLRLKYWSVAYIAFRYGSPSETEQ